MGFTQDPEKYSLETGLFLKHQLLLMDAKDIAADLKYLRDNKINADFLALFNKARAFRRKVRGMSAEAIFALGKANREAAQERENRDAKRHYRDLAKKLFERAAKKGHVEARYILAMDNISTTFDEKKVQERAAWMARKGFSKADIKFERFHASYVVKDNHKSGREALSALAMEGYGPAQREVAQRHAIGEVFPKDRVKAYYWMLRAARQDAALGNRADALGQDLSLWQRLEVRYWILMGQVPEMGQMNR